MEVVVGSLDGRNFPQKTIHTIYYMTKLNSTDRVIWFSTKYDRGRKHTPPYGSTI